MRNSKLMQEGYVQGLKKAQNIIRKMIKESDGDVDEIVAEIEDFMKRINDQFDKAFEDACYDDNFDNVLFDFDSDEKATFDIEYLNMYAPSIEGFSNGNQLVNEIIEKALYDVNDDCAHFKMYPDNNYVRIPNFRKMWEESQHHAHGNRTFHCTCEINDNDYPKSEITIYFA